MLGATALLWGDRWRGCSGGGRRFSLPRCLRSSGRRCIWASFATYDALSVFLVALAAWCVVRAGERQDATGWMIAAGVALALANAAAYSSVLFDPVVILLALLTAFPQPGGGLAGARALTLLTVGRAAPGAGTADRRQLATSPGSSRPRWSGWAAPTPR